MAAQLQNLEEPRRENRLKNRSGRHGSFEELMAERKRGKGGGSGRDHAENMAEGEGGRRHF